MLFRSLDGATRVHGNVYKLVIDNDKSAEIGVRVQALEAGETPISERPCGGCCRPACESSIGAQLGNAPIGLAVLVLAASGLRRRRKRR